MGRAAWSAFACSSLAAKLGEIKEQERLFQFGLQQGRKFIEAIQAGQVNEEDLRSEPPMYMLMLLQGPTADFMLGRVYEAAQDSALHDVVAGTTGEVRDEASQKSIAGNKFTKQNCRLIGE